MYLDTLRKSSLAFYLAYQQCLEPSSPQSLLAVPGVVCVAFSIELGLKCLILRANGKAKKGNLKTHNLMDLFNELEKPIQEQIVKEVNVAMSDFTSALEAASNTFKDWRYVYEGKKDTHANTWFLSNMAKAVHKIIG